MRRLLDIAPLVALLGVWALGGLASALVVVQAEGSVRHLALGIVTLPALVLVGQALRRAWCGAGQL